MTIKNLVFEGGGVKGITYAGAIHELDVNGLLSDVESVAGTSAGAITAALLALDYSSKDIIDIINNLNFKSFEDGFDPLRLLTTYGLYKGDAFLNWMKEKIKHAGLPEDITFDDLYHQNKKYKTLRIFATDLYTQSIQEFSVKTTPNTIVAEAVRASMSIPIFFKSWQFSNNQPNNHLYVDGGVLLNYPLSIFDGNSNNFSETLGFYLENTSGKPIINAFGSDHITHYIKSLFDTLLQAQNIDFSVDKVSQSRTVIIDDLGISATDFSLTEQQKQDLMKEGQKATKAFIDKHNLITPV